MCKYSFLNRIMFSTNVNYLNNSAIPDAWNMHFIIVMDSNPLTPNDHYSGRTTLLTSKRCILYIYSTNIGTEYFKHGIYSLFFFSSKCSLFHHSNLFGSCIIHILYTECAKIKKNNSGAKRLIDCKINIPHPAEWKNSHGLCSCFLGCGCTDQRSRPGQTEPDSQRFYKVTSTCVQYNSCITLITLIEFSEVKGLFLEKLNESQSI